MSVDTIRYQRTIQCDSDRAAGLWLRFAAARFQRAMELITILNRCHLSRGFVYQHAHFGADKKSIVVAVQPRKGSTAICSCCHLPAPGYDQLAERRFVFFPSGGLSSSFCTPCGGSTDAAAAVEEVPWGDGKPH